MSLQSHHLPTQGSANPGLRTNSDPLPVCVWLPAESGFAFIFLSFFLFFSSFFWGGALPAVHGSSRTRGQISRLQLPAYTTATATRDLSCICDLHDSLWQCQILNPLSVSRDQTHILTDTSQVLNPLSHKGNSPDFAFLNS